MVADTSLRMIDAVDGALVTIPIARFMTRHDDTYAVADAELFVHLSPLHER
jgi:hypothetical protein